jgi:hypothetical protein
MADAVGRTTFRLRLLVGSEEPTTVEFECLDDDPKTAFRIAGPACRASRQTSREYGHTLFSSKAARGPVLTSHSTR